MSPNSPLDVICVGEALVDFLPDVPGKPVHEVERWVRCSGGSLANVAVGLSRLGAKSGMVSVVGRDEFGTFLHQSLRSEGVDVSHLRRTEEGKTGLVFISLGADGERQFAFYRTRAAELFLSEQDVDAGFLARARAVHCGTNSLLFRDAQRAMVKIVQTAKAAGKIVTCDPNLRLHMWPDPRELQDVLALIVPYASVVKLSEEELEFVTGLADPEAGLASLAKKGVTLPVLTLGAKGAMFLFKDCFVRVAAPVVPVVDTTGAGDGFMAGLLYGLTRMYADHAALLDAGIGELREVMGFACQVGARAVTQLGAVTALPRLAELEAVLPRRLRASRS